MSNAVERAFREESGRVLATLIRHLGGDFQLAEDALQDAFAVALATWPRDGVPANPGAWITTAARRKAIDRLRRERALHDRLPTLHTLMELDRHEEGPQPEDETALGDDRLRLVFTCCHPALAMDARVALTLRTLGGLTTAEIARAFLVPEPTMAQRLVRAKRKIAAAAHPLPRPGRRRGARSAGRRARRRLPRLQRGLRGQRRRAPRARRAVRRGDPPRSPAGPADARRRRDRRAAGAHAHPRRAPRRARGGRRQLRRAARPGPRALGRGALARGPRAARPRAAPAPRRPLPAAGGDRLAALRAGGRLAADRGALPAARLPAPSPVVEVNRAVALGMAGSPDAGLSSSTASSSIATSPSTSRTPSCCAAAATTRPPTAPTRARSSSARTRWSGRSSSGGEDRLRTSDPRR